ncbi:MAG: S8 family serine peptidase [Actinomyces sp.]|nr:S8 family serine peptidase [Actinomyces sp.]
MRRGSRRAAVASGCALALAGSALVATPTRADDRQITAADQAYFSYYHLDAARAKGYTGKGVTIAIIDGKVDTSVPELAGANVVDKSPCAINGSNESASHGTGVASLLVSQDYGIVPDATLLAYQSIDSTSYAGKDCPMKAGALPTDLSSLVNQAINDGASIVNFSASSSMRRADLKWAIARAMSQGVIITASVGNGGADENENHLSRWSGVVGVSAIDTDGKFASYSSWGQGVTTTAVGGPFTERNISDGKIGSTQGTSYSAPIVAGALAQARAQWPNATANQLLQLLVNTAVGHENGWNQYGGYGAANLGGMLNTDPSQYPDENPLADKGGGTSPTPAEVQQYADGLVDPSEIAYDNSYAYRGLDESQITNKDNTYPIHLGTSPRFHRQ